jgi:hypothetical protein
MRPYLPTVGKVGSPVLVWSRAPDWHILGFRNPEIFPLT